MTAMIVLLVILVGGFNYVLHLLYTRSIDSLDQALGARLLSIGRAAAPYVEEVLTRNYHYGELSLSGTVQLDEFLRRIQRADDLSGIYLINRDNEDLLAWNDTVSNFSLLLPLHLEALSRAHLGEASVSPLYRVDERYVKSAYLPLGEDSVEAVLLIESSFSFFAQLESYRSYSLIANIIALAAFLVIGAVILLLNRGLIRAEKLLVSQAALSQMGQMAAVIAHEVRNPLAIIKASAERLKKKFGKELAEENELLDFIPQEVDRLSRLTTYYLQFAAPADRDSQLEAVGESLRGVVDGLRREAQQRGVNLVESYEKSAATILVEATAVRQIAINLIRNALDATPSGGTVAVSLGMSANGDEVVISVEDTGAGLSKSELKRIFDPFYTTKVQGSGLGLFVVRRLVNELRGQIDVTSQVGVGTKFVVVIPGRDDGENTGG